MRLERLVPRAEAHRRQARRLSRLGVIEWLVAAAVWGPGLGHVAVAAASLALAVLSFLYVLVLSRVSRGERG